MQKHFVYVYKYQNGTPFYVGKGYGKRHLRHLEDAKVGRNLRSFNVRTIRKLLSKGEMPIIEKLIENIDNEFACLIEQEYIAKYGRRNMNTGILTNMTAGGDGATAFCQETLDRISKRQTGVGNSFYGKKHTEETKKRISESCKKHPNIRYWKGKTFSEEHLAKLRIERTCPHCGIIGKGSAMHRHHFNNCKKVKV